MLLLLLELAVIIINILIKALTPIHKITGVHANLLKAFSHHAGHNRLEVDVCHQGHIISAGPKVVELVSHLSTC